ncbi:MAG: hypothetical protein QXF46_01015 [Thermofilaceae archaeon]
MVQERRSLLIGILRKYFHEKGYSETAPFEGLDLTFTNKRTTVGVKVLSYSSNPVKDQKAIRSCMYRLLRDKPCDEIYFATEEIRYSHLPSFEEFKESGIGLLKVSEDRIEVAVPARPFGDASGLTVQGKLPATRGSTPATVVPFSEEILFKELERKVIELIERKITEHLAGKVQATNTLLEVSSESQVAKSEVWNGDRGRDYRNFDLSEGGALQDVDFLKGNPWLSELMKRGSG